MAMSKLDKNNAVLSALGHPIRRKILRRLEQDTDGALSPKMLAEELDVSIGNVSYHFRLLTDAGILKLVDMKARRGAMEHYYRRAGNGMDKRASEVLELIGKD